jgi:hypothetical protein
MIGTWLASTADLAGRRRRADRPPDDQRPCAKRVDPQPEAPAGVRFGAGASWCPLPRPTRSSAGRGLSARGCLPTVAQAPHRASGRRRRAPRSAPAKSTAQVARPTGPAFAVRGLAMRRDGTGAAVVAGFKADDDIVAVRNNYRVRPAAVQRPVTGTDHRAGLTGRTRATTAEECVSYGQTTRRRSRLRRSSNSTEPVRRATGRADSNDRLPTAPSAVSVPVYGDPLDRVVCRHQHSGRRRRAVDQPQRVRFVVGTEQPVTRAEHERVDHQE